MNKKEKAKLVDERLEALYPDVACALEHHDDPFRLLIMAILSAQCTDARVNIVSGPLFERFPDARSIAESSEGELEELIRSVGLYNSKAKNIRRCCRTLVDEFGGEIPEAMEDLLKLGAGRWPTSSAAMCSVWVASWRTRTAYVLPISSVWLIRTTPSRSSGSWRGSSPVSARPTSAIVSCISAVTAVLPARRNVMSVCSPIAAKPVKKENPHEEKNMYPARRSALHFALRLYGATG